MHCTDARGHASLEGELVCSRQRRQNESPQRSHRAPPTPATSPRSRSTARQSRPLHSDSAALKMTPSTCGTLAELASSKSTELASRSTDAVKPAACTSASSVVCGLGSSSYSLRAVGGPRPGPGAAAPAPTASSVECTHRDTLRVRNHSGPARARTRALLLRRASSRYMHPFSQST